MITIRIDKSALNKDQIADYLRDVALMVEENLTSGIDWEIEGAEEQAIEVPVEEDEHINEETL